MTGSELSRVGGAVCERGGTLQPLEAPGGQTHFNLPLSPSTSFVKVLREAVSGGKRKPLLSESNELPESRERGWGASYVKQAMICMWIAVWDTASFFSFNRSGSFPLSDDKNNQSQEGSSVTEISLMNSNTRPCGCHLWTHCPQAVAILTPPCCPLGKGHMPACLLQGATQAPPRG